jgi:hypothetical protein
MASIMIQSHPARLGEGIVEPMIALARCAKHERIIVAGTRCPEFMFELHRRGYARVATTANCGLPEEQYDVALVDWRQRSMKSLETALDWLVDFLNPAGLLVIWTDHQGPAANRKLRSTLESHGFFVEAGSLRADGSAISARRWKKAPLSKVA